MSKRTQRRREIEHWLSRREAQGLTLRDLSARSGIPVGTLAWWSHRLRKEQAESEFVDLGVVELSPSDVAESASPELVFVTVQPTTPAATGFPVSPEVGAPSA
ncbi:MAG: helix-turn-helix transcriptional regulator [Planctomycetes bacterium]|nr:helix-turn-helix transcriptional regulator [Planctomycetota bacterium]